MPKKTRLGDDAAIYQQKNTQMSEKEKLKNMSWKDRFDYIWEYYKYHGLAIVLAIILIIYTVITILKPKTETILYAAIVNNPIPIDVWPEYKDKLTDYLELDPETEDIFLNYNFYFNTTSDYEVGMRQVLSYHLAASEIDLIIAPLSEFSQYVKFGFFDPLSDQLPTDLYSLLTDKFYLSSTEDNPRVSAYGIYLTDTKLFREYSITTEEPYLIGIVVNSKYKKNAIEFIRYIFSEK
ncbi:hypothetical protein DFR55_1561 [Herbinix hemicellulosilytica]|uniref:Putative membrane protein n=1 Tax=Herbinix hemicellulosilytica TaxID=1564487 RepID=A0A0H5SSJ3_HERHM|nr:hypothetical protein [Herbinix hemicellulosilytica]RBP55314.1 hypothetical protein DFR55_1561 [Herbinix hemicellulosilytica]CRZ33263.1 putative membrane protein [Herbinix hemicellulosilytica]